MSQLRGESAGRLARRYVGEMAKIGNSGPREANGALSPIGSFNCASRGDPPASGYKYKLFPQTSSSFFSSSALFAYWLRSSVVSVLFSLISESFRPGNTLIIPIFRPRDLAPVLAHASSHSVIGLTLPPIDANSFFINCPACPGAWRRCQFIVADLKSIL